jgi:DNA-binding transcriptional MerR regulator
VAETMTIAELAERSGLTARNIRSYQSRGLLFGPEIRGRVAHYNGAHLARLMLIGSLQREGFTLAAVKRLIESPGDYSAIVADRRRRFREGSSDITTTVPIPEERIGALLPDLPEDLTETGLAWRDGDGHLVSHTVLVGVGRMLATQGVSLDVVTALQLEAARTAAELGTKLREHLDAQLDGGIESREERMTDLARVAVQLSATAYEIAFLQAASRQPVVGLTDLDDDLDLDRDVEG